MSTKCLTTQSQEEDVAEVDMDHLLTHYTVRQTQTILTTNGKPSTLSTHELTMRAVQLRRAQRTQPTQPTQPTSEQ